MSKVFKVAFSYTVYGTALHVEADTKEEAEKWLFDEINLSGIAEFEHNINDRDYNTQDAEEVL